MKTKQNLIKSIDAWKKVIESLKKVGEELKEHKEKTVGASQPSRD